MESIKKFIEESWKEYISFFSNSYKDRKRRVWLLIAIILVELLLLYGGYELIMKIYAWILDHKEIR